MQPYLRSGNSFKNSLEKGIRSAVHSLETTSAPSTLGFHCFVLHEAQFPNLRRLHQLKSIPSFATMFDQLKHVVSRPLTGNAPAEKHFTAQSKLEKSDPSTAFERSGWVYI